MVLCNRILSYDQIMLYDASYHTTHPLSRKTWPISSGDPPSILGAQVILKPHPFETELERESSFSIFVGITQIRRPGYFQTYPGLAGKFPLT